MGLSTNGKGHSHGMASECNGMSPLPGAGSGELRVVPSSPG